MYWLKNSCLWLCLAGGGGRFPGAGTSHGAGGNGSADLLGSSYAGFGANNEAVGFMKSSDGEEESAGLDGGMAFWLLERVGTGVLVDPEVFDDSPDP